MKLVKRKKALNGHVKKAVEKNALCGAGKKGTSHQQLGV